MIITYKLGMFIGWLTKNIKRTRFGNLFDVSTLASKKPAFVDFYNPDPMIVLFITIDIKSALFV